MKEKEKDFDTLASDILIELYNDIKEHETDLMEDTEKERRYEDKWGKDLDREREKPGGSNAGKYLNVDKKDLCGASGGSASGSYPVRNEDEARAALKFAHFADDPEGIRRCVYRKAKEHDWDIGAEEDENLSAKKARAGEDIGKPGKNFEKISDKAAKKYGSKKAGDRVAGAILAKMRGKR